MVIKPLIHALSQRVKPDTELVHPHAELVHPNAELVHPNAELVHAHAELIEPGHQPLAQVQHTQDCIRDRFLVGGLSYALCSSLCLSSDLPLCPTLESIRPQPILGLQGVVGTGGAVSYERQVWCSELKYGPPGSPSLNRVLTAPTCLLPP